MRTITAVIVLIIASAAAFFLWPTIASLLTKPNQPTVCTTEAKVCPDGSAVGRTGPNCAFAACPGFSSDYKNGTYTIDGQPVTLTDGVSKVPAVADSASSVTTTYFGDDATGDLSGDGEPDVAFILTQNSGGSGTFYYVVVALKTENGYLGTNAVMLGDRIAPQTTQITDGQLIVNYADRKPGEPMTTPPSVGVSKYFHLQGSVLVET